MAVCPSCEGEVTEGNRFCPACGISVAVDTFATRTVAVSTEAISKEPTRRHSTLLSSNPSSSDGSRFVPGTLFAERYRIIALLGRGGMGEVYRADDLTLGQQVALKFLPEALVRNEDALRRFRNEVRTARQVSHPNVCRVYDLGEVDDLVFLSMEYVDGEDLGCLLRRIGRLPGDKAVEISRKLCAGLAAAHEKGVLHRDLKPGNVMLDSRGQVLLTDFGLAGLAAEFSGAEIRNGTPAYMAPEQIEGKEVTVRSDIYSLGLVLYEIFTGKRPFEANSLAELVRARTTTSPVSPSTLVLDLDPAVERAILRCLELEPSQRPPSALAVSAALPGGDPLAAALAAGDTPSPQMVAAAGGVAGLKPWIAVFCLAFALAGLFGGAFWSAYLIGFDKLHLEHSPEVLAEDARTILKTLGYGYPAADSANGYFYDNDFLDYVKKNDKPAARWNEVLANRPPAVGYWYRQSTEPLTAWSFNDQTLVPGIVTESQPAPIRSGMVQMRLDQQGRLTFLEAIPPQMETAHADSRPVNWDAMLAAGGLERSKLQSAEPTWTSLAGSDARAAWTGTWPGTSRPLRVEAAAYRGLPVFFSLIGPWTKPDRMHSQASQSGQKVAEIAMVAMFFGLVTGAALMARKNFKKGKGDRRGALRLAAFTFVAHLVLWIFKGHHVLTTSLFGLFVVAVSGALFNAAVLWLLYMAVEPYVRRHWPHSIISWNRLLAGRIRDPLLGRDILFGIILGVIWMLLFELRFYLAQRLGDTPEFAHVSFLLGPRASLGAWFTHFPMSAQATLLFFSLLFFLRVLLRNQWLASIVFVLIFAAQKLANSESLAIDGPLMVTVYGIAVLVVVRFGLVALAAGIFTVDLALSVPISLDPSMWYEGTSILIVLSTAVLAIWAFYTSLAGQSIWSQDSFE